MTSIWWTRLVSFFWRRDRLGNFFGLSTKSNVLGVTKEEAPLLD